MTSWHHNIWQNKIYFTNYVILLARYLYWQRSQKMIEWTTFEQRPAVLILIFDHVTWTSIRVIYSLWVFTVPSFATFKQRGQKTLSGQHFFNDQQSDLDLWLCDLKSIGVIYSLWASISELVASTYQLWQLSSKKIKRYWAVYKDQSTDPQVYKKKPPFLKGGH